MNSHQHETTTAWYRRPALLGALALGGIIAAYVAAQNWEQAAPYLPWLLILALPLLHVVMHGGHDGMGGCGGHGSHGGRHRDESDSGHEHSDSRNASASVGPKAIAGPGQGDCCGGREASATAGGDAAQAASADGCCGGAGHAHGDAPGASAHAHGGDCCGGQNDKTAAVTDEHAQHRLKRR